MKRVEEKISHPIKVSPEQAWTVIGAVEGVDLWFSSMIKSCKVENGRRYCETTDGVKFEELILEVSNESKTFKFAIPELELLPVENVVEVIQVKPGENGGAIIDWSASFDTEEGNESMTQEAFRKLWTMGLNELEQYILNSDQS